MAWTLTDHLAAAQNINLLLLNPLLLVGLLPKMRRASAWVALLSPFLAMPFGQYNLDVLVLAAPLNLAAAAWLFRDAASRRAAAT